MKQLLLSLKDGKVAVEEVPPPILKDDGLIVENHYSVVSGGSEKALLELADSSYIGKARKKPDLFKKVVDKARKEGPLAAYQQAMGRLNKPEPLGYSCAGVVSKVSEGLPFKVGDRVACGGLGYANHADVVFVPENLCVNVPDNVSLKEAAFTTLGSIAMQGVRNADTRVGESVAVIGLGLIGQLTVQILKASGCQVFGIDVDESKIKLAKELGMDDGSVRGKPNIEEQVSSFTRGQGFDSIIITAATTSKDPLEFAGNIARHRATVVLVGVVGMEIPRDIYYLKEISFVVSCSYGPGRYDREYEEFGHDYPIGYVRWTENRNMGAFLSLLSQKKIRLDGIISHEFEIKDAVKAYQMIKGEIEEPYLGVVLKYEKEKKLLDKILIKQEVESVKKEGVINIGMIGAGQFATSVLLQALKKVDGVNLVGLSAASGLSSKSAAENFGFEYCTTDYKKVLSDEKIDAVIIATRNSLHAPLTIEALENGKHVFVEKPLAIDKKELDDIVDAHKKHLEQIVQVGFNRRYAPMTKKIKEFFRDRKEPMILFYRVNAGHIPKDHWIYDDKEGRSRFITELCHFVDFCRYVVDSEIVDSNYYKIDSDSIPEKETKENVSLSMKFKDGSIATVIYNTIGDSSFSKEYAEIYSENSFVKMTDFKELVMSRNGKVKKSKHVLKTEKGHKQELEEFVYNIKNGKNYLDEFLEVTNVTLR